jgi:hypothetical protein
VFRQARNVWMSLVFEPSAPPEDDPEPELDVDPEPELEVDPELEVEPELEDAPELEEAPELDEEPGGSLGTSTGPQPMSGTRSAAHTAESAKPTGLEFTRGVGAICRARDRTVTDSGHSFGDHPESSRDQGRAGAVVALASRR